MAQQTNMCSYSSVEYEKKNTRKKSTDFNRFQQIYSLCRGVGEKADFQYFSIFYWKLCFWPTPLHPCFYPPNSLYILCNFPFGFKKIY